VASQSPQHSIESPSRYPARLGIIFAVWWVAMAIAPKHRSDWVLENVLTIVAVVVLLATYRRFPLSRISYTTLFLFACLHTLGSHYTYAEVPYDEWARAVTGHSINGLFGWERNHFDRFVHFLYGLLAAYPIREIFIRIGNVRGFWGYFLPLDLTMSSSMVYELVEWGVAEIFGGDLGMAYLGTQGDIWDAHKDMALASLGAVIAMGLVMTINRTLQRDFAHEWAESLRVKRIDPLDEI
jgi:putative membrane protein